MGIALSEEGGADAEMRWLLIRSLYLADDYANAALELRAVLDADARTGAAPQLVRLQLLASCYVKLGDNAGYVFTLEKLLALLSEQGILGRRHPSCRDQDGIRRSAGARRAAAAPSYGHSERRRRIRGDDATRAGGRPACGSETNFRSGLRSRGAGHGRRRGTAERLRDTAAKQMAEDENQLVRSAKAAVAAPDGAALVNVGFAYAGMGQFDKGIALMEQGMQKGGLDGRTTRSCTSGSPISRRARRPRPCGFSRMSVAPTARPISRGYGRSTRNGRSGRGTPPRERARRAVAPPLRFLLKL